MLAKWVSGSGSCAGLVLVASIIADGKIHECFAFEHPDALFCSAERGLAVAKERDAALVAGKGVFERQIARLHFLDDGLKFRDRRFE